MADSEIRKLAGYTKSISLIFLPPLFATLNL